MCFKWGLFVSAEFKSHHIFTHIHMHPYVVLFADVRNGNEGVKGSIDCCSSCCAYKEWYKALQGWRRETAVDTNVLLNFHYHCCHFSCVSRCVCHLLFGLKYSPFKVSWHHFTTARKKNFLRQHSNAAFKITKIIIKV